MSISKYQHQHDLNGCGIACLTNLLRQPYLQVKHNFENQFYPITKGVKVSDMVKFLQAQGLSYQVKFFNHKSFDLELAKYYSSKLNSITLIRKNEIYPIGHYLLRVEDGWVDPWFNYPSIDGVYADLRQILPNQPWYVIYLQDDNDFHNLDL